MKVVRWAKITTINSLNLHIINWRKSVAILIDFDSSILESEEKWSVNIKYFWGILFKGKYLSICLFHVFPHSKWNDDQLMIRAGKILLESRVNLTKSDLNQEEFQQKTSNSIFFRSLFRHRIHSTLFFMLIKLTIWSPQRKIKSDQCFSFLLGSIIEMKLLTKRNYFYCKW